MKLSTILEHEEQDDRAYFVRFTFNNNKVRIDSENTTERPKFGPIPFNEYVGRLVDGWDLVIDTPMLVVAMIKPEMDDPYTAVTIASRKIIKDRVIEKWYTTAENLYRQASGYTGKIKFAWLKRRMLSGEKNFDVILEREVVDPAPK